MNRLYYGDCLAVMEEMGLGSVDLIYLDPPFNSNRAYNAIYKDETGRPLPDQIEAFCDAWTLDDERERAIAHMPILIREAGIDDEVAEFWRLWVKALRQANPKLLAYLSYMVQRLLPMRGLLKPTGSIYLHCDPTASHYLKIMMDAIFGHQNFVNEIVWRIGWISGFKGRKRGWIRNHDIILYYVRSPAARDYFNKEYIPYPDGYTRRDGAEPTGQGIPIEDTWNCSEGDQLNSIMIMSYAKKMGYATEKPVPLLERIIKASSNPGDVVFDPFCGCATTLEAAHKLDRQWIGVDIAVHAIKRVAKVRLEDRLRLVEGKDFLIDGIPRNMEGAVDLWERDKYHFQKWAVEEVDGFVTTRRTGDGGIDGRLYFAMPQQSATERDPLRSMVIEVKGGENVTIGVVRDLRGVLERDDAEMAGLILLRDLSERKRNNFLREMGAAGEMDAYGVRYPRMQLLTVEQILDGARFKTPSVAAKGTGQAALPLAT